jgi:hypothetical protein
VQLVTKRSAFGHELGGTSQREIALAPQLFTCRADALLAHGARTNNDDVIARKITTNIFPKIGQPI